MSNESPKNCQNSKLLQKNDSPKKTKLNNNELKSNMSSNENTNVVLDETKDSENIQKLNKTIAKEDSGALDSEQSPDVESFEPNLKSWKWDKDFSLVRNANNYSSKGSKSSSTSYKVIRKFVPPSASEIFTNQMISKKNDQNSSTNINSKVDTTKQMKALATSKLTDNLKSLSEEISQSEREVAPWMPKPKQLKDKALNKKIADGLEFLNAIRKFYIYKSIQIFDNVFDRPNTTKNCFTVRNADYQQVYYVGTAFNRKPGRKLAFTLRIIDQYNRLVILVKKRFNSCFGSQIIDIESPPGVLIGKMKQKRQCWGTNEEYFIYDPIRQDIIRFIIKGFKYGKKSINEFDVSTPNESIGSISKRYEKILAPNKVVLCEDPYTRVNVTETIDSIDKALILSAGLLINIFYLMRK